MTHYHTQLSHPNINVMAIKPVLSSHSKIDKTKVLKTDLQYFSPTLSDNWSLKQIFSLLFEWPLQTGFTVLIMCSTKVILGA